MAMHNDKYLLIYPSLVFGQTVGLPKLCGCTSTVGVDLRVKGVVPPVIEAREDVFPAYTLGVDYPFGEFDL
ncbi:hypothetical protein [Rhodanobacter sp. C01]|uniref:hypothetical protein n=1 Tax=Rhodanobacter sp. C01 TaxID=1945856 RepID=UPI00111564D1|nr:hypothetical protein [Rhodanobacter sp. C01]